MKRITCLLVLAMLPLIAACQRQNTVCPADSITYFTDQGPLIAAGDPAGVSPTPTPALVEINGKVIRVDQVVHGRVCEAQWAGTVYVACDIQIAAWSEAPLFLEDCPFAVEPGSTVYVAAHNNAAYYKGCSCHTGQLAAE